MLRRKYLRRKSINQVERMHGDSQFWTGLMGIKHQFLQVGKFEVHSGKHARFWEDVWLGSSPLKAQYPTLFNIAYKKQNIVSEIVNFDRPKFRVQKNTIWGNRTGMAGPSVKTKGNSAQ